MLDRFFQCAVTRAGSIVLLGAACVVLLNIHAPYQLQIDGTVSSGNLAELQVGLLLAIAMLARDRWVFPCCVAINVVAWMVSVYGTGLTPALAALSLLAGVGMYGWMWLCVRWMGWPRAPEQQMVTVPDLYRFALFGVILIPLGQALVTLAYAALASGARVTANSPFQSLFGRYFGILILTMPLVIGWSERHRAAILGMGRLHWPLLMLLLLAAMTLGSVWLLRQADNGGDQVLLLTDYRIALLAAVGWCIVSLRLSLSMAMLSLALFLMALHLGHTAQVQEPLGFFSLLHRALETSIVLLALLHYTLISRDRVDMTGQLVRQTRHNSLTGLPNLRALRQTTEPMTAGTLGCLLLDRVDSIRIGYGLDTHADLLQAVARTLADHGVEPFQLGNTEFALLSTSTGTDWGRILHAIERQDFGADGQDVRLLPYLGVARFGDDAGINMDAALVLASSLAVEAKRRHEVEPLHADAVHDSLEQVQGTVRDTNQALAWLRKPDGLVLYFQPIIALSPQPQRQISGEVLCRLRDDGGGILAPAQFLNTIEAARRGPELDLAVITRLFEQLRSAPDVLADCAHISVNLTGQSLAPESFRVRLLELLDNAPLPLSKLCFEITETVSFYSAEHAEHLLGELRRRGCQIAIDDFGVGMQSFARLKELQMDIIKIDGSFVRNITREYRDYAMVEASVSIARACHAEVVAEFVEDEATATCLRQMGVQWGQGYLYARPMPLLDGLRLRARARAAARGARRPRGGRRARGRPAPPPPPPPPATRRADTSHRKRRCRGISCREIRMVSHGGNMTGLTEP